MVVRKFIMIYLYNLIGDIMVSMLV
jgi:hypothetical protein